MVEQVFRLFLALCVAGLLAACARPVGDLGRARPGVLHDEVMPAVGQLRALVFGEDVSFLNLTDDEVEMHDRAWRFIVAPHSNDWFFDVLVEWQRTRLLPPLKTSHTYNRYYLFLRSERYRSSHVRYNRLARDINADIDTMPGVFDAICRVEEIDRRRGFAVTSVASTGSLQQQEVYYRQRENDAYIAWFKSAARYRYNSYSYALEQLLI